MKTITFYRNDFKEPTGECNFFEDLLFDLGIPKEIWNRIQSVELTISGFSTNDY